jgi:hypothetical protein
LGLIVGFVLSLVGPILSAAVRGIEPAHHFAVIDADDIKEPIVSGPEW